MPRPLQVFADMERQSMQNGTSEIIIRSHAPELQEAKLMNMQAARAPFPHCILTPLRGA